jgi:bacteriorhodopsin
LFAINFGKSAGSSEAPAKKVGMASGLILRIVCFVVSMVSWCYVLFECYFGELAQAAGQDLCIGGCPQKKEEGDRSVAIAFNSMRLIVTVGWSIYPAGYVINSLYDNTDEITNVIYNVADMINKCLYGVMIYIAARGAYWSNDVCHAEMGFGNL